jgi:DNA-binding CsgD family transcriptional regulator
MARAAAALEVDPTVAGSMLEAPDMRSAASESRYLRDFANRSAARAALYLGDLEVCLSLARHLAGGPSLLIANSAARLLGIAGLLARDPSAVDAATALADARLSQVPGTHASAEAVAHQRALLDGAPTRVDPEIDPANFDRFDPPFGYTVTILCREAIDAGDATLAVAAVRARPMESPLLRAVHAAIEAAANIDEDRWREALTLANDHGLRLIATDALEGLAVSAAASEAWVECLRLTASADCLRDETGYRWRFRFEEERLAAAVAGATEALGTDAAGRATAEGAAMDWHEATAYASRARGERKRPSHGWAALTPTELQVVALAADGLSNPQIAERLLMGRATVKTHLDHAFTKTGVRGRTELAAEYVRRTTTPTIG